MSNYSLGNNRGEPRGSGMVRGGGANKVLTIETPALPLDELNKITGNFGAKSLIGEGSYGHVFYANFNNRASAATKKLHAGSSQKTGSDFTAHVKAVPFSLCNTECSWYCHLI